MEKTVVVLGVARGGTSMTAGLVAQLGVHIATDKPSEAQLKFNPRGMYEHKDFFRLQRPPINKVNLEDAMRIFKKHGEGHPLWGFKSLSQKTIGSYLKYLTNPHLVVVTRSLGDNAKSWQAFENERGSNFTLAAALKSVTESALINHRTIALNPKYPFILTTYESIRKDPVAEATKIAAFLGIPMTSEITERAHRFVNPNMRTWESKDQKTAVFKRSNHD